MKSGKQEPMWKQSREEYSPLRPLRESGRLYFGKNRYSEPNKDNISQTKAYDELKDELYNADLVQKQLLDMFVNRLSKDELNLSKENPPFKKLSFKNKPENINRGGYDRKEKKLNLNLARIRPNNPTNILNHELAHASNDLDTNLEEWMEKELEAIRGKANLANQYKYQKYQQEDGDFMKNAFLQNHVNKDFKENLPNIETDLFNYTKFIQNLQDTIDPLGGFGGGDIENQKNIKQNPKLTSYVKGTALPRGPYPAHRIRLPSTGDAESNTLQGKNSWRADELNAHFIQNLSDSLEASKDPATNNFLSKLIHNQRNTFSKDYELNKYPAVEEALDKQLFSVQSEQNPSQQNLTLNQSNLGQQNLLAQNQLTNQNQEEVKANWIDPNANIKQNDPITKASGGSINLQSSPQSFDFFNSNLNDFNANEHSPYIEGSNYPYNSPMNGSINEQQLYPLESNMSTNFLNSMSPNLYNKGGRVNYKGGGFASILGALGGHAIMPGLGGILGSGLGALLGSNKDNEEQEDPRLAQLMAQLEEQGKDINPMSLVALLEKGEDMDDHEKLRRKIRKDSGTAYMQGGQVGNNPYAQAANPYAKEGEEEEDIDEEELMKLLAGAGSGNAPTFGRGGNVDIDELLEALHSRKKNMSFIDKLTSNSSDYFSDPGVLMGLAGTAARAFNKPKRRGASQVTKEPKQTPEERAMDIHRFNKAMRLSSNEMREEAEYRKEADYMDWLARNNLNYGEFLKESPLYVKRNDEEEAKKRGRWLEYYDNPNFTGNQLYMADGGLAQLLEQEYDPEEEENKEYGEGNEYGFKDGGSSGITSFLEHILGMIDGNEVDEEHHPSFMEYEDDEPDTTIIIKKKKIGPIKMASERYVDGDDGGQDDTIPAKLSDGEYVMDASTVSDIGDGNNRAGARKLDRFRKNIRKQKRGGSLRLPPKTDNLENYFS